MKIAKRIESPSTSAKASGGLSMTTLSNEEVKCGIPHAGLGLDPAVPVPEKALRLKTWKYTIVAQSANAYIQPILFQPSSLSPCTGDSDR